MSLSISGSPAGLLSRVSSISRRRPYQPIITNARGRGPNLLDRVQRRWVTHHCQSPNWVAIQPTTSLAPVALLEDTGAIRLRSACARREEPVQNMKMPFVRSLEIALFIAQASVLHRIHRNAGTDASAIWYTSHLGRLRSFGVLYLVGYNNDFYRATSIWCVICFDWVGRLSGAEIPSASRYSSGYFVEIFYESHRESQFKEHRCCPVYG